jgi:hypothetical protein
MSSSAYGEQDWTVRGLALPSALITLMALGAWRDPDETALRDLLPWFDDPLVFLDSIGWMRRENEGLDHIVDDERSSAVFRMVRGSREPGLVELPWLDIDQAILIAVNRNAGDDVAVALDLRTDPTDPRVVASDIWSNPRQYAWRIVTPTFTQFAAGLGLR